MYFIVVTIVAIFIDVIPMFSASILFDLFLRYFPPARRVCICTEPCHYSGTSLKYVYSQLLSTINLSATLKRNQFDGSFKNRFPNFNHTDIQIDKKRTNVVKWKRLKIIINIKILKT